MARLVLTKQDTTPYIPEKYRGDGKGKPAVEKPPTFKITTLTGPQRREVFLLKSSAATNSGNIDNGKWNAAMLQAAVYGLEGWDNVEDQDNNNVEYPGSGIAAIHLIPMFLAVEVGAAVCNRSELSEDQQGN